jgi:hypothetical protein
MNKRPNMSDPDEVLLARVVSSIEKKDFCRSILVDDVFDDWHLAQDFANFLIRIEPEEIMGHAILARAYRHLGERKKARLELEKCRVRTPHPAEEELLRGFLESEDKLLS